MRKFIWMLLILLSIVPYAYAATRDIVPRADTEGSIGTAAKQWGDGRFVDSTFSGTLSAADAVFTSTLTGVDGTFSGTLTWSNGGSVNANTAFTHSQDNTQAHTDYLLNSGDDIMGGTLTADGLILGQDELITIGANTITNDGTDFVFDDTIAVPNNSISAAELDEGDDFTWTSDHIFNGTMEIPNGASDVVLTGTGQMYVDSAQKQLVVSDGIEKAIPLRHIIQGNLGTGDFDADPDVFVLSLDADTYPDGIVITEWAVDCNEADPTTELNANIKYANDRGTGAFPGASDTLVDVIDTTTGNSSENDMSNSDLTSGVIPTGVELRVLIDADPVSDTTLFRVKIHYFIPES